MPVPSNFDRYQRIAKLYDILDLPFEYSRYRHLRPLLFSGLAGRLLEAGVGTGRNFPFYPPGAEVFAIDISPAMLAIAERRRGLAPKTTSIHLQEMDIVRLAFPDQTFDAAVATFLFCVLDEDLQLLGLNELRRVIRPGGLVRLLEYTRPSRGFRRALTKLWEPWVAWAYGASFDRRTEEYVPRAGLELVQSRFVVDELIKLITARVPEHTAA